MSLTTERIEGTNLEVLSLVLKTTNPNDKYCIAIRVQYKGKKIFSDFLTGFRTAEEARQFMNENMKFSWVEELPSSTTSIRRQRVYFGEKALLSSKCENNKIKIHVYRSKKDFYFEDKNIFGI